MHKSHPTLSTYFIFGLDCEYAAPLPKNLRLDFVKIKYSNQRRSKVCSDQLYLLLAQLLTFMWSGRLLGCLVKLGQLKELKFQQETRLVINQLMDSREQRPAELGEENVQIKIEASSDPNNSGRWTEEQNFKYIIFLDKHKQRFQYKLKRRKIRLFQLMAEFIGSRSSIQCRTHHQKYQQKFGASKNIINIYKEQVGNSNFRKLAKDFSTKGILERPHSEELPSPGSQQEQVERAESKPMRRDVGVQTQPWEERCKQEEQPKLVVQMIPQLWFPYYY